MNNQYCSKHFKKLITIFLKKLDKNIYNILKIYKSIILLNIIDKILESIMTNRLAWTTKTYNLLFNLYMKKKREISSKLTIYALMKRIHAIWENKRVINALLLNVSNAFDNVLYQKLLHNFRKRKIENSILNWIRNFIKNQQIKFRILDHIISWMKTNIDISQKSSFFSILYFFYNVDLLKTLTNDNLKIMIVKYIDDVIIMITNICFEKNNRKLLELHEKVFR